MNKLLLSISVCLFAIVVKSQNTNLLQGQIDNFSKDSISVEVLDDFLAQSSIYSTAVTSDGKFKLEYAITGITPIILRTGKENIALVAMKGDSINCRMDFNRINESLVFLGDGSSHYNYFIEYYQTFQLPHAMFTKPDFSDIFSMSPAEFKKYRTEKVKSDLMFLDSYCDDRKVSELFRLYSKIEIEYSYYYALAAYPSLRSYFKGIKETLPLDFYSELNKGLFSNDSFLISNNYLLAMNTFYSKVKGGDFVIAEEYYDRLFGIISTDLSNKSLYISKASFVNELLNSDASMEYKDSIISEFFQVCPYQNYNSTILTNYKKTLISNNKLLPKEVLHSTLIGLDEKEMTFGRLLRQWEGNIVYLDIWASFCGPCKVEMPFANKLKDDLKGFPVKFIYFSIDTDKGRWTKAIDVFGIKGDNYLIENELKSEFSKYFNIYGVPHYILIDKDGKVIFPSAARPSSKSIANSIKTLCNQ